MVDDQVIEDALDRLRKFEALDDGWREGDEIPVQEAVRYNIFALEALLAGRPTLAYYCRAHKRAFQGPRADGCDKCRAEGVFLWTPD